MLISAMDYAPSMDYTKPPAIVSYKDNQQPTATSKLAFLGTDKLKSYKYNVPVISSDNIELKFSNLGLTKKELIEKYSPEMKATIQDIDQRAGKKGQVLNWIRELPKNQLKNIDDIYYKALKAKLNGANKLVVIGIGGSKHTMEAMSKLLNVDDKLIFYSALDDESFNRFIKKINLEKTKFLVVSKSGTTLETMTAYNNSRKYVESKLGKNEAKNRFIVMTDKGDKSELRKQVNDGKIKISGLVHDDVGGRFSIFDDATIFAMAFAGIPKKEIKEMLKASIIAQEKFLNQNLNKNIAAQQAMFNVEALSQGKNRNNTYYFGDAFEGVLLWEKQLKNESLKDTIATETNLGPAYLHYNAEAEFALNNKNSTNNKVYHSIVYQKPSKASKMQAYLTGVLTTYDKRMNRVVSVIELKDLGPKSIAEFIEFRHFETLYTGNLMRRLKKDITPLDKPVPEVLQPNVKPYKMNVKEELKKIK